VFYARERKKMDTNRKGRSKIIPIYRQYDPITERYHQKVLRSDKHFSKVSGYKINIQKSASVLIYLQ
jgi:hypothetical protein